MVRILLDTCILTDVIIYRKKEVVEYFRNLMRQHENGLIEIVNPKAVQAELYSILRACRTKLKIDGKWRYMCYSHEEITERVLIYKAMFNEKYLVHLNTLQWPSGKAYKEQVYQVELAQEYGWHDLGKSYIERHLNKSCIELGLTDCWDYPVMASAILHDVDLIVTGNMKDFIDPLGRIRVKDIKEAIVFDHFDMDL